MDRERLKEWIGTAVLGAGFAAIMFGFWHYKIEMPRKARAERIAESAAFAALKVKVERDFGDYLRATPLLKGDVADALDAVVTARIQKAGLDPYDPQLTGDSPARRWRAAQRVLAEQAEKNATSEAAIADETRRCSTVLPPDQCRIMVEAWYCSYEQYCTQSAVERFDESAVDRGYISEDEVDDAYFESHRYDY